MKTRILLLTASASLGLLLSINSRAATQTWDFDDWYSGSSTNLNIASSASTTINYWDYQQWTGGNPETGGFLQLTPPEDSRMLAIILPDIDDGVPVKAFKITADVRAGNGTNTPPADGFSISYVRETDVALSNALNVILNPGTPPYMPAVGLLWGFAGGDSDAQAVDPAGANLPENGTKTGLSICFDAYAGNRLPDTGPGGTPGPDLRGIAVRVDDHTLIQTPMTNLHQNCDFPDSMQTGPYDGTGAYTGLSWCKLEVEKTVDNRVTVIWKGVKILDNYQVANYPTHRGRLILAGRTGGLNQNVHFDNITLETVPGIEATFQGLTINPDYKGWTFTLLDTGASQVTNVSQVLWNGVDVTSSVIVGKAGGTTTGTYTQAARLPSGGTNQVVVTFKTTLDQTLTDRGNATTPSYVVLPVAYALPLSAVTGQPRGIAITQWQTATENRNTQGENRLNWTEEQLLGLHGANLIDIVGGNWPTNTDVLDYQNNSSFMEGNFRLGGPFMDPPYWDGADYLISSLGFGSEPANLNDEDGTIEWFAYVNFPEAGVYHMVVNSDDGFRLTTARHAKDRLGDVISAHEGAGGAGTGVGAGTLRNIAIDQPGVYPIRGFIENRVGGFNVEWYTVSGTNLYLVNSNSTPESLAAWQTATGTGCYVQSAIPVRDAVDILPNQKIIVQLANGSTTVNAGTIVMKVDGVPVSPVMSGLKLEVAPTGLGGVWASSSTHTVELTFTDSASNAYSYSWQFTVGAYQMYQAPYGAGGKWNLYLVLRGEKSWVEAEQAARTLVEPLSGLSKAGHLVTLHSTDEADFVRMIAAGESVWIGLTDDEAYGGVETGSNAAEASQVPPVTGSWVWVTGEPYTFGRWNDGEPNDWNQGVPGEDAIELYNNGLFNDNNIGFGGESAPNRDFVVEFETLLDNRLADVPYSVLPPGPLPGPAGCDGVFGIRAVRNAGNIPTITAAVNALSSPGTTVFDTTSPVVNFNDLDGTTGGGGIFGSELPLPGNLAGEDEDVVIVAKARISITASGDYTFGVHSDDGFALRIRDQTWKSISGAGQIALGDPGTIFYQYGTGDADTRGVVTLAAGEYDLEFVWFEDGGGAYVELYAAKGAFTCDVEGKFWLVGGQPATSVDVGVSPAGWTVEYNVPQASPANTIAEAEASLAGALSAAGVNAINYRDPEDAGSARGCSVAFPQNTAAADNNFAIRATAQLVIPVAGTYHFGFQGDDGGYLQIEGQTWDSIVATANAGVSKIDGDRLTFDANTGDSRTVGAITLAAGTYTIRALFWENGGGAWFWVFGGQPGSSLGVLTANNSPTGPADVSIGSCIPRPSLKLVKDGGVWKLVFTGTLFSSPTVNGTYEPVAGATSPYTIPTGAAPAQFYRARF